MVETVCGFKDSTGKYHDTLNSAERVEVLIAVGQEILEYGKSNLTFEEFYKKCPTRNILEVILTTVANSPELLIPFKT